MESLVPLLNMTVDEMQKLYDLKKEAHNTTRSPRPRTVPAQSTVPADSPAETETAASAVDSRREARRAGRPPNTIDAPNLTDSPSDTSRLTTARLTAVHPFASGHAAAFNSRRAASEREAIDAFVEALRFTPKLTAQYVHPQPAPLASAAAPKEAVRVLTSDVGGPTRHVGGATRDVGGAARDGRVVFGGARAAGETYEAHAGVAPTPCDSCGPREMCAKRGSGGERLSFFCLFVGFCFYARGRR